ncbi:hypothetical protein [Halapricum desulfuricans]|uniref:Uncharacterized protein n=1 Tax=Halapricum desulfuricans TaxID=2841257 RepID=A0A897MW75_9EURY|nr:hypothetical protein [Halapricum desulfuricans]QSG04521.1 hypothetical protein HSR121_0162 [Halapricum desulfuricans]
MAAQERRSDQRTAGVAVAERGRDGGEVSGDRWIEAMRERLRRETGADETFVWTGPDD